MAVYDRTWRRYQGAITPQRWRWLVITRYAIRGVFASKAFLVFYLLSMLPTVGTLVLVYACNNLGILQRLGATQEMIDPFLNGWLTGIFPSQAIPAFLLTVIVSPGLVAPDLANGAMPLYLSRPITRRDYVIGKMVILGLLISPITWIGSSLFLGLQAYFRGFAWLQANSSLLMGHLLGHLAWIVVISLLSLAISAWVRFKWMARALLLGQFFVLGAFSLLVNLLLSTKLGGLINLGELIAVVVTNLFDSSLPQPIPVWSAWTMLVVLSVLSVVVLARKVKAHEVIR